MSFRDRMAGFSPRAPFQSSPRPDQQPDGTPASTFSARFSALHSNVRTMINGSSVYSNSPDPANDDTPKIGFLGFLRRPQSPPSPIIVPDRDVPRDSTDSRSPLRPQHTAGSYMRTIGPMGTPREPEISYHRHPADVPLNYGGSIDPETAQIQDEVQRRRRRRRRHHKTQRKHHRASYWVRRRDERGLCYGFIKNQAARGKCLACTISGLFLLAVLTIYLTIALTKKSLGQEVHVLFIMLILATTIFFCHSLIRLCMLALHPPSDTPRIPSITGPEGFRPINPIRVHLARDEELADALDTDLERGSRHADRSFSSDDEEESLAMEDEKEKPISMPPPAYGLWRSSVRVDPNLLHWQRVNDSALPPPTNPRTSVFNRVSAVAPSLPDPLAPSPPRSEISVEMDGPRPPSYVSEDGVSYIVEAAPRSMAPANVNVSSGMSDIHPAWRPGFNIPAPPRRL